MGDDNHHSGGESDIGVSGKYEHLRYYRKITTSDVSTAITDISRLTTSDVSTAIMDISRLTTSDVSTVI